MSESQPEYLPEAVVERYTNVTREAQQNGSKAHKILRIIQRRRHTNDVFLTEVNTGPTSSYYKRIDGIAVKKSWSKPLVTAYEVKISRQDFERDDKWPIYLSYCHSFYFACPPGLIQPEELPPEVGLLWIDPDTGHLSMRRKAVHRAIEIPSEILYYMVIARTDSDRYPFFSDRAEFFRAMVEDKVLKGEIGRMAAKKMHDVIKDLYNRVESTEHIVHAYKQVEEVMRKHGLQPYLMNIGRELDAALSAKSGTIDERKMERVRNRAEQLVYDLKELLEETGEA